MLQGQVAIDENMRKEEEEETSPALTWHTYTSLSTRHISPPLAQCKPDKAVSSTPGGAVVGHREQCLLRLPRLFACCICAFGPSAVEKNPAEAGRPVVARKYHRNSDK